MKFTRLMSIALGALLGWTITQPAGVQAEGAGTSGGTTLLAPLSVRAEALGEAFSTSENDVTGFGYNPASLGTLSSGQASFLYQKGLLDDAFGRLTFGLPTAHGGFGVSVGYYDAGSITIFDGTTERTVSAQRDYVGMVGYSRNIGTISLGLTGKYLSSELIEEASASAFAGDFGMQAGLTSRLRMGAAIQNIGTSMKYVNEADPLPRKATVGMSYQLIQGKNAPTALMFEAPYFMNEKELRPSLGLETIIGPLAIRGGYKKSSDFSEFSFGAGFALGRASLDYAFGLVKDLDAQHKIGLSMRFGSSTPDLGGFVRTQPARTPRMPSVVNKPVERERVTRTEEKAAPSRTALQVEQSGGHTLGGVNKSWGGSSERRVTRRIYEVQPGDSLASIAKREYGSANLWKNIYMANKHLIDDPRALEAGQKIVLP